jgi:D-beta-D-heptose 7-phosphate kinase/D-beta-D-heptose 1-phosphate adenosyltransferase
MLDHYVWGKVTRVSPEAPVQVLDVESSSHTPGGAANVVHNLQSLGAQTGLAGVVGADESGNRLRQALAQSGVDVSGLIVDPDRPTTTKTRIIAHSQQLLRTDWERRDPIHGYVLATLLQVAEKDTQTWHAVVLSDYNKGVLQPAVVEKFVQHARSHGAKVVAGPKPENLSNFRGAHLIALNQGEAAAAVNFALKDDASVCQAGRELLERLQVDAVLITRGEHGMSLFQTHEPAYHVPALASQVYDVSGAGDTVIATLTLSLAAGATLHEAVNLANLAAAVVVRKVGTATTAPDEILASMPRIHEAV